MYPVFIKPNNITVLLLLLVLLLASLLLAACGAVPGMNNENKQANGFDKKISPEYHQAVSLMQANDMQSAAKKFKHLLERYPQLTGAWANLGLIHLKAGEWDKAEKMLQQAVKLNPAHAPAYNYLGVVKRNQGQFKQAEQAYKKAIEADSTYAIAKLNLGILYDIYMNKPTQALTQYEHYQQLNANTDKKVNKWIVELKRRIPKQSTLTNHRGDSRDG